MNVIYLINHQLEMPMFKILSFTALMLTLALATAHASPEECVNQIEMRFSQDMWVDTQSADVFVDVSASLSAKNSQDMEAKIISEMARQSGVNGWRVVSVDRAESNTGLQNIQASVFARLPIDTLVKLQISLKELNSPGVKYAIGSVDFAPSADESSDANSELRSDLYEQVKTGLKDLKKAFPNTSYEIHDIRFSDASVSSSPRIMMANTKQVHSNAAQTSSKMTMVANTTYASASKSCN